MPILNYTSGERVRFISESLDDIARIANIAIPYRAIYNRHNDGCSDGTTELCSGIQGEKLVGCCKPYNVRYMMNVMIKDGKFIVYDGGPSNNPCSKSPILPQIMSSYYRQVSSFTMPVERVFQPLPVNACTSYFNGTLHVSSRGTIHNLFHALNDNVLPIMAQIVTDLFMAPEFAHLPRINLGGFHVPADHARRHQGGTSNLPHVKLFNELFQGGDVHVKKADGMCFRRVVWGTGLRIHYIDALVVLRRLTADFARSLVLRAYNPPVPTPFSYSNTSATSGPESSLPLRRGGHPLRVLLISRGAGGKGRSMQGEKLILDRLQRMGAAVMMCCDFDKTDLSSQLAMALHADVIIGLHGAGLVNAIFAPRGCILVELKTLYGYTSDIFVRSADSRSGVFVQIDARKYSNPGEVHKADEALANRVLHGIVQAMQLQREGAVGVIRNISTTHQDFLIAPSATDGEMGDLLGPTVKRLKEACETKLSYAMYRQNVLKDPISPHQWLKGPLENLGGGGQYYPYISQSGSLSFLSKTTSNRENSDGLGASSYT
eukprot:gene11839-24820_t